VKTNDFDRIAGVYDPLAKIVFGKAIRNAQLHFSNCIPTHSCVLIIGGGTGWIAEELIKQDPTLRIVLIDASQKMIDLAKLRLMGTNVELICGDENDLTVESDVVITPFFLDLFPDEKLQRVIRKIQPSLKSDGLWIATDFVTERWWHRIYLWMMYRFFKITTAIESNHLPDWQKAMLQNGFHSGDQKTFYKGFVKTICYKR
jgi:Methylase involved in ubiquinone/menaquinone biosynthesis